MVTGSMRVALLYALGTLTLIAAEKTPTFAKSNKSWFNLHVKTAENRGGTKHGRVKRSTDFTSSEITSMLARHNYHRSNVNPEAADMKYMSWDDDLATMAQQWSEECRWGHGQPDNISPFAALGQNLWMGGPYDPSTSIDVEGVVDSWHGEVSDYDYDSDSCSAVCGHYTQVVWSASYAVGCGIAHCPSVMSSAFTDAFIVTCNYGPAGNYIGLKPYLSGDSCSVCDEDFSGCRENQCYSGTASIRRTCDVVLAFLLAVVAIRLQIG